MSVGVQVPPSAPFLLLQFLDIMLQLCNIRYEVITIIISCFVVGMLNIPYI